MATQRKEREKRVSTAENVGLAHGHQSTVQRFGEATSAHLDAYFGEELNGKPVRRGLKHMHDYKRDPNNPNHDAVVQQQTGKAAEVRQVAQENAKRAIEGKESGRVRRTDDEKGTTNHKKVDVAEIGPDGQQIKSPHGDPVGSQLKFGATPENTLRQVRNKFEHYADVDILVPADQVDAVKAKADAAAKRARAQAERLKEEARRLQAEGQTEQAQQKLEAAQKKEASARRDEQIRDRTKAAHDTNDQAKQALLNPKLVTAREVLKTTRAAGLNAAKSGAIVGAAISGAQNIAQVLRGEKEVGEAVVDTVVNTGKAAAYSYAVGAGGALVKAGLEEGAKRVTKEVGKKALQRLAQGSAPGLLVVSVMEVGKSLMRYLNGELDAKGLALELGEKGTGIAVAEWGATAGAALGAKLGALAGTFTIPIPGLGTIAGAAVGAFIGGLVGGMAGYLMGTALFRGAVHLLQRGDLVDEQRRRLEALSQAAVAVMERERQAFLVAVERHFADRLELFTTYFTALHQALLQADTKAASGALAKIAGAYGGHLQFQDSDEFDRFMSDPQQTYRIRLT